MFDHETTASLVEERRRQIEVYMPFAESIARGMGRTWPWMKDDLISEAYLGLIYAIDTYDPSFGTKRTTWIFTCVLRYLLDAMRRELPRGFQRRRVSGSVPRIGSMAEIDVEGNPEARTVEERDSFEALLRRLPERNAEVLRSMFVDDQTQADVATRMGWSPSLVSSLYRQGLKLIEDAMNVSTNVEQGHAGSQANDREAGGGSHPGDGQADATDLDDRPRRRRAG